MNAFIFPTCGKKISAEGVQYHHLLQCKCFSMLNWSAECSTSHLQQELAQGHKGGPVVGLLSPALQHDVVDVLRAVFRLGETLAFLVDLVQDLGQDTDGAVDVAD